MYTAIINETANWLATTGAPNGVVLLALLTSPATWSEKGRELLGRVMDRAGLAGAHDGTEAPDEEGDEVA